MKIRKLIVDKWWLKDNIPFLGYFSPDDKYAFMRLLSEWLKFDITHHQEDAMANCFTFFGHNRKLPSIKPLREREAERESYLFLYEDDGGNNKCRTNTWRKTT